MASTKTATVQSLSRGLLILSWLADCEEGLSLAGIAARLGVSRSTAFNLAGTLAAHGYVTKTSRPVQYRLGPAVGLLHDRQHEGRWRCLIEREACALAGAVSDCFLFFCENTGGDMRVTLRLDPRSPGMVERTPARPIAPYVMALSLGYLAFCGGDDRREYMRTYPFAEYGQGRWQNEAALERILERAREDGFLELGDASLWRFVVPLRRAGERLSGLLCASRHAADGEDMAGRFAELRASIRAAGARINEQEKA